MLCEQISASEAAYLQQIEMKEFWPSLNNTKPIHRIEQDKKRLVRRTPSAKISYSREYILESQPIRRQQLDIPILVVRVVLISPAILQSLFALKTEAIVLTKMMRKTTNWKTMVLYDAVEEVTKRDPNFQKRRVLMLIA